MKSSIRLWVAGFFSSRNIVAILLFHWESWLGFGMTINPGKRKTRRFALGKSTFCSKIKQQNSSVNSGPNFPNPSPVLYITSLGVTESFRALLDQGTSIFNIMFLLSSDIYIIFQKNINSNLSPLAITVIISTPVYHFCLNDFLVLKVPALCSCHFWAVMFFVLEEKHSRTDR